MRGRAVPVVGVSAAQTMRRAHFGIARTVALAVLATSCHPAPVAAVTAFGTALAIRAGDSAGTCALVFGAVGTGQLSIGWSNDRIDAAPGSARCTARDKPLAAVGPVAPPGADGIAVALAATVALSLSLGWRAGVVHLAAVACAWATTCG